MASSGELDLHVSISRNCDDVMFNDGDEVFIGQDLFLSLTLNYKDREPVGMYIG